MKNPIKVLFFFFLTTVGYADIVEIGKFHEVENYICPDTLFIVDIDDTLLIPVQTLGTDVWFLSRLQYHLLYSDQDQALDRALAEWEAVRHLTQVKILEEGTAEIIQKLQNKKIALIGLTTQGLALTTRTIEQLQSLSIDLSLTAPSAEDYYFMNGKQGVLYKKGILFTAGTSKGEALLKLLDKVGDAPQHVVFINDKKTHLEEVEKSVESRNISFTGLRYSYSDQRVAHFSQEIADIQWKYSTFEHLLSDEEAYSLLNQKNL